jgi:phage gp46-like protein
MPDIATIWDIDAGQGDWLVDGPDLARNDDLQTAVLISLFTDRRAAPDDVIPDGSENPRGWWGDSGRTRPLGSKLWLLDRAKQTEETRLRAKDYVEDALAWLIEDGIAASIIVEAEWQRAKFLGVRIVLFEPTGTQLRVFNYQWAWKGVS